MTLAYIAGISLTRCWFENSCFTLVFLGFLFLFGLWTYCLRLAAPFTLVLLGVFILGGFLHAFASLLPNQDLLYFAEEDVVIVATVIEEPYRQEERTAYSLQVESLEHKGERYFPGGKVQLYLYHGEEDDTAAYHLYGEKIRVEGKLREPSSRRNPGGFDYRFFLRGRGIDAYMNVQPSQVESLGDGKPNLIYAAAFSLRRQMAAAIGRQLPSPQDNLLTGILFGQRHDLPEELEANFRAAGLSHLLAVSGLHVGLIASLLLALFQRLHWQRNTVLFLCIILIFSYALLTGMRPSTIRAAIMVSLTLGALILGRQAHLPSALALAALLTLIYNPLLLFTPGFQLSYAAVLSLFYLTPQLEKKFKLPMKLPFLLPPEAGKLFYATLAVQLGTAPLVVYHFGQLSLIAILVNLLALPVITFVVGLGLSASLVSFISFSLSSFIQLANLPLLTYLLYLARLGELPFAYLELYFSWPMALLIYLLLFLFAGGAALIKTALSGYMENKPHLRVVDFLSSKIAFYFFLFTAVIFLWSSIFFPANRNLEVVFLDVGQGDAVFVSTPCGIEILIDGGGSPAYLGEDVAGTGSRVLLPFLRHRGVKELDILFISHPHEDHFGGLFHILGELSVKMLLTSVDRGDSPYYEELLQLAGEQGVEHRYLTAGDRLRFRSGVEMHVLGPPSPLFQVTGSDINNNSLVLRLDYGETSFLFTGDIEEAAIRELLKYEETLLPSSVLKIPHHGAYNPSLADFLERVAPETAVIPVGTNYFGHPHPETLSVLEEAGVSYYRTDIHGAVLLKSDGQRVIYQTMLD
ncbi:MAG: DNA internalization-related competence protein ComEC/Rec2 [Dethiobacteria bacterium]